MPIYCYKCENGHKVDHYRSTVLKRNRKRRCPECGLYLHRDQEEELKSSKKKDIHLDYNNDPISHLVKKRTFKGIIIENLTPNPVMIRNKSQYERLLKNTHSREKGR